MLVARVHGGVAPFTWLADGRPFALSDRGREAVLDNPGRGFLTLSVINALGRSARAQMMVR